MRSILSIALLVVLSVVSARAWAEPTAPERETARTLVISGRQKRAEGHVSEALADFERAHAIMHVPTTALELGSTQEKAGKLVDARATLLESLRKPPQPGEPEAYRRARIAAKKLADEIAPRLATLTIEVPEGTTVRLDDVELSPSSLRGPLKVDPGRHAIVATASGREKRRQVELAEGEARSVELPMPQVPDDGRDRATKPEAAKPRYEERTNPLVWLGLGVGAAGIATGLVTGYFAVKIHSDVEGRCVDGIVCPPATHDDIAQGKTFATVSTVSFVVVAAAVAVFAYGIFSPKRVPIAATAATR